MAWESPNALSILWSLSSQIPSKLVRMRCVVKDFRFLAGKKIKFRKILGMKMKTKMPDLDIRKPKMLKNRWADRRKLQIFLSRIPGIFLLFETPGKSSELVENRFHVPENDHHRCHHLPHYLLRQSTIRELAFAFLGDCCWLDTVPNAQYSWPANHFHLHSSNHHWILIRHLFSWTISRASFHLTMK